MSATKKSKKSIFAPQNNMQERQIISADNSIAPEVLKTLYKNQSRGTFSVALRRLITDAAMIHTWKQLGKMNTSDAMWLGFWNAVRLAIMDARRELGQPKRETARKKFSRVSSRAKALSALFRSVELDLNAYEIFPDDAMGILGIKNWPKLDSLERADEAHKLLASWPSVTECLDTLAKLAQARAIKEFDEPRLVRRKTLDARPIAFTRSLHAYFMSNYKSPFYGTIAKITGTVFQIDWDKNKVTHALRKNSKNLSTR